MSLNITQENYDKFILDGVSLLDIYAEWCGPCKTISPIIDKISEERSDIKVGKLDADQNKDIVARLGVRSIPTILLYKNGEVVERKTGSLTKDQLESMINNHV